MSDEVSLRGVRDSDLPIFFENEQDPDARRMAAFTSADPHNHEAFMAHWTKIRNNSTGIVRTILWNGQVAGSILSWQEIDAFGDTTREVGYWLGKPYWGKGIATRGLAALLRELPERPIYAHAAKDNHASIHVLEKCGFTICGEGTFYSHARSAEIPEVLLRLDAPAPESAPTRA